MQKKKLAFTILFGILMPWLVFRIVFGGKNVNEGTMESQTTDETSVSEKSKLVVKVLGSQGEILEVDLNAYLVGVVLGELPASFQEEAVKAQVVAVRTLTIKRIYGKAKHGQAAVCMEPGCCQAYCDPVSYCRKGGSADFVTLVSRCVESTDNLVLTYQGELIDAAYFSCSGGRTENAVAVWGTEVPYLQAVNSPGEEFASHYTDCVIMDVDFFRTTLEIQEKELYIGSIVYTSGGGVESLEIAGQQFSGTELRKKLSLCSTAFTIDIQSNQVVVTTRGFGHRVGMSQYGAEAMARAGSSYSEILAHYYTGAVLTKWQ